MKPAVELGIITHVGRVPVIVARLRDAAMLHAVMEAILARAAESDDVAERQEALLVAEMLGGGVGAGHVM